MGSNSTTAIAAAPDPGRLDGAATPRPRSLGKAWAIATTLLGVYFLLWWTALRPGVFSDDSATYLIEALSGHLENVKPFFYARFLQVITLGGHSLNTAALIQALIASALLGRMFALGWVDRAPLPAMLVSALVVVTPHCAAMLLYVQNDPLFCVAMLAILVETLHCAHVGRLERGSVILVALLAPMALLFRQNGLLFLPLWALSLPFLLPRRLAWKLLLPALVTCALGLASIIGVRTETTLNARFPAVIHAIAGLSRAEYGKPVGAKISVETRQLIGGFRLHDAVKFYAPGYWDFIAFYPGGPKMVTLAQDRQKAIVDSFIRNDMVANLPALVAIRTELWLNILMGRGLPVSASDVPRYLPETVKQAKRASVASSTYPTTVIAFHERAPWLRSAVLGLLVLMSLGMLAFWRRDARMLWVVALVALQAGIIFVVAPSSDSRYLFFLYLAPFLGLAPGVWSLRAHVARDRIGPERDPLPVGYQ